MTDFVKPTKVAVSASDVPRIVQDRTSKNPFLDDVSESYDAWKDGQEQDPKVDAGWFAFQVPADQVKSLISKVEAATTYRGMGLTKRTAEDENGNVNCFFQARDKRAYTERKTVTSEQTSVTPETVSADNTTSAPRPAGRRKAAAK